jgi:hypothetical protein
MSRVNIKRLKNALLLTKDERGLKIQQKINSKASKIEDILLLIFLFGLAFFKSEEVHVIIFIAFLVIIKTMLKVYFLITSDKVEIEV